MFIAAYKSIYQWQVGYGLIWVYYDILVPIFSENVPVKFQMWTYQMRL